MDKTRQIISLNGDWQFAYTKNAPVLFTENSPDSTIEIPKEEAFEIELPVPAYWDDCKSRLKYAKFWARGCAFNPDARRIEEFPLGGSKPPDASLPYLLGTGWYKTHFMAEADWKGKCVELHVGGAMLDAWVWLNGHYVGTYYSCGKPFEFALDKYIKAGTENELIIAVSNTRKNRNGCSIRGFKGKSAGINRSVELVISGTARIEDCYVRTNATLNRLFWEVTLRKKSDTDLKLRWSIINELEDTVIALNTLPFPECKLSFETDTFGMKPWSDNNPNLYKLKLELINNGTVVDSLEQSFGLRFLERKDLKIIMNDNPLFLRGTTDHAYFPETCTVPNDLSYYMRTIKTLKAAGFNWMRFHTTIPPEECLEAADKLGMLIQVETQNGFSEEEFINMLLLCRKHPSVILYCCGNEVPIKDEFEEKLEKMSRHCRTLAPDCLFDPMEALLRAECVLDEDAPGYTEKPVPHNARKLARIREYSDVLATAVWVFSYHSLYPDVDKMNERFSIYQRPCLIHEAGIFDTYLNLDLEKRYENTRIGTELFAAVRRYIDEMGLLDRAPVYYQNSCKWMKNLMKFALEKARRCETIAGYDFLGATDCHWHRSGYAVGVMNEFYELKSGFTFEELRQFNGESILVCDAGHERSLFAGQKILVKIYASLYGNSDLGQGTLYWSLTDDANRVRLSGEKPVTNVARGITTEIAEITVGLNKVHGIGEHMRLNVELRGGIYAVTNSWDYWIFNQVDDIADTNIRIAKEITPEDVKHMENGGRILLLGSGPFPGLPITYQITPGGRVNGNSATVIYDHPLLRDFPHDGFCDWQFAPMFKDGGTIVFNELDIDFKPIVEIVSTYKMIKKQASIFELKAGNGGMLVCTLNVQTDDPAAKALYNSMLRYLASDKFAPSVSVTAAKMAEIIEMNKDIKVDFTTDECYDTGGHIEV